MKATLVQRYNEADVRVLALLLELAELLTVPNYSLDLAHVGRLTKCVVSELLNAVRPPSGTLRIIVISCIS